ncbi:MAG: NAD(P)(+) transhydrogenase (Re/Si-specific) subunit beta [Chitinophagaceae bacterium]|nr:NAD(P)(+) transhydrogenase (Re/Si-specific) subunit beta [Chitinophagaceae bacterium]
MGVSVLSVIYILSAITFILGLKLMSNPVTARKGNQLAGAGMFAAVIGTIFLFRDSNGELLRNHIWIFSGIAIGSIVGVLAAKKVKMTAMPEMVSLFNGLGGASASLIALIEFLHLKNSGFPADQSGPGILAIIFSGIILGNITFSGSVIAWGKLSGKVKDFIFKGQHIVNLILLAAGILLAALIISNVRSGTASVLFWLVFFISLLYGVLFVMPIGGADMPVVISLLNSLSGLSAATGGFLYNNKAVYTAGILVGAAGTILTVLMCKAMNRSLMNVLIGAFGGGGSQAGTKEQGTYKEISLNDAAVLLSYANKVMVVPGYGLAVAQAQHACHDLEKLLESKGVEVKYAIHPVAGRMPGHMNVLLAEADVSYDKLLEMEPANEEFPSTDVVLVLGANDVVNPAAKNDPSSPIYGMPILDVGAAKHCIVVKRSMKPGYAGIENDLFFQPKTSMLFGDAKKVLQELSNEIKNI